MLVVQEVLKVETEKLGNNKWRRIGAVMFFLFRINKVNVMSAPIGSLAATGLHGLLGSPRPTSFSAFTLNWYSWFGIRFVTFMRLSEMGLLVHATQRTARFSFLSRM